MEQGLEAKVKVSSGCYWIVAASKIALCLGGTHWGFSKSNLIEKAVWEWNHFIWMLKLLFGYIKETEWEGKDGGRDHLHLSLAVCLGKKKDSLVCTCSHLHTHTEYVDGISKLQERQRGVCFMYRWIRFKMLRKQKCIVWSTCTIQYCYSPHIYELDSS